MSYLWRGLGARPSFPIPIRGAKEPVDSGRPYLKPSTKEEKREEKQKPESAKAERQEKASAKRRYAKRRAVKVPRRTWFLVKWVPKIKKKTFLKIKKSKMEFLS